MTAALDQFELPDVSGAAITSAETASRLQSVPDLEQVYGPEVPHYSYIVGRTVIKDRVVDVYTDMEPADAMRVSLARHEFPGTRQFFPGQLLRILRGETAILCNITLQGVHQLGSRVTVTRAMLTIQ